MKNIEVGARGCEVILVSVLGLLTNLLHVPPLGLAKGEIERNNSCEVFVGIIYLLCPDKPLQKK